MITSESTTFTLDNMGRFLCNTLQEARDSAAQTVGGHKRDFDVIIIGGGTFGSVIASIFSSRTRHAAGASSCSKRGRSFCRNMFKTCPCWAVRRISACRG